MTFHKKVIVSGALMSAVAFAPFAFAADITTQTNVSAGATVTTAAPKGAMQDIKAEAKAKKAEITAEKKAKVEEARAEAKTKMEAAKTEAKDKMETAKAAAVATRKANFSKEEATFSAKLDALAAKGLDVTAAKAKLAESMTAADAATDSKTLMAARKTFTEAKKLAPKTSKKAAVKADAKAEVKTEAGAKAQ